MKGYYFILILRNAKARTESIGSTEKSCKKSSTSAEEIFYREEKNGKVTYEFNATYRKPSDSGWVSEVRRKPSIEKKSKTSQPEIESVSIQEKYYIFDVTSAKLMSKEIQRYLLKMDMGVFISLSIDNQYLYCFYLPEKRYK